MTAKKPEATEAAPDPRNAEMVTLDEFCRDLSSVTLAVEMIGGFHASMLSGGHQRDTRDGYRAKLNDYRRRPVA